MAFPVVVTADCKAGTGDAASITPNYPDNLVAGDLILFLLGKRGRSTITPPSSPWVSDVRAQGGGGASGAQQSACWAKKVSTGSESGGTFAVSWSNGSAGYVWFCLRITGWYGTLGTTFDNSASSGGVEKLYAEGNSNQPNPPNLDPASWGTEDTLWLASEMHREAGGGVTAYPSGFNLYQLNNAVADLSHSRSGLESAVGSVDPGVYTLQGGDDWITTTIAIRPEAFFPHINIKVR